MVNKLLTKFSIALEFRKMLIKWCAVVFYIQIDTHLKMPNIGSVKEENSVRRKVTDTINLTVSTKGKIYICIYIYIYIYIYISSHDSAFLYE